jgi:hypothetical protein
MRNSISVVVDVDLSVVALVGSTLFVWVVPINFDCLIVGVKF